MRYRASSKFRLSLAILCGVLLVLFSQTSVLANGRPTGPTTKSQSVNPMVTCSGSGCTGKNPYSTGCSSTGYPQNAWPLYVSYQAGQQSGQEYQDAYIPAATDGEELGWVQNYYSTACHSNWSVVTENEDLAITASIEGQSTRIYWWGHCNAGSCPSYIDSRGVRVYWWHSPMYYAPTESTAAYGNIDGYDNCLLQANNGICDHP